MNTQTQSQLKVEETRPGRFAFTTPGGKTFRVLLSTHHRHGEVIEIVCEESISLIPNAANGVFIKMD